MKKILLVALIAAFTVSLSAQKFLTKEGYIKFYSSTPMEDIVAEVNDAASILNSENGEVVITLKMVDFEFEKKLMEEHFNENYVESEKYPKSSFKGFITNNSAINYKKDGKYTVSVKGDLTIHGVTNTIETFGTVEVRGDNLVAKTSFVVAPADYGIEIPKIVREKIAKEMEITVELKYAPLN